MNKVRDFIWSREESKKKLTVYVYGDNEPTSSRMWYSIFRDDEDIHFCYSTEHDPIPIPANYRAEYPFFNVVPLPKQITRTRW